MSKVKVGVIGGGFGGLAVCDELKKQPGLQVELIDAKNHHLFQPLLYQVAMAGLNPGDIAIPLRRMFANVKNISVRLAKVSDVDVRNKSIKTNDEWASFDYLVFACGSKHHYFGNSEWEKYAPGLKTIAQATEIRRRVLLAFEKANSAKNEQERKKWLTFAIVGGGPTGVELAGAISEMARFTLYKDYENVDLREINVLLVEAGEKLLGSYPEKLINYTYKELKKLGVEVMLNSRVTEVLAEEIKIDKKSITCGTTIWAAGVKPAKINDKFSTPKAKDGRLLVEKDLSLPGQKNIFVIGDQAAVVAGGDGYLPGLAPVALQQGKYVGKTIINDIKGKKRDNFNYFDKGTMATIGRSKAVLSSAGFEVTGFVAWWAWIFVHILFIARFKNRFFIFMQWAWSYFRFGRGARLIVNKNWRFYGSDYSEEKNKKNKL